jgi:hypothetical protein
MRTVTAKRFQRIAKKETVEEIENITGAYKFEPHYEVVAVTYEDGKIRIYKVDLRVKERRIPRRLREAVEEIKQLGKQVKEIDEDIDALSHIKNRGLWQSITKELKGKKTALKLILKQAEVITKQL